MTSTAIRRILPFVLSMGILTAKAAFAAPTPESGVSDSVFVASHLPAVQDLRDKILAQTPTALTILDGVRQMMTLREQTMTDLDKKHSLSSLDGIETMDAYDEKAVVALVALTNAFVEGDSTAPDPKQVDQYNAVLGGIPSLGETPVAFMVFGIADLALFTADKLWSAPAVSQAELAKTTINLIHYAADTYDKYRPGEGIVDLKGIRKSGRFHANSVIMRMRCPKDDGAYEIVDIRKRAASNGDIMDVYYLRCQVCQDARIVNFVQPIESRLNRTSKLQRGQKSTKAPETGKTIEP